MKVLRKYHKIKQSRRIQVLRDLINESSYSELFEIQEDGIYVFLMYSSKVDIDDVFRFAELFGNLTKNIRLDELSSE